MHTIRLQVEDSIYQNIIFLLKNLKLDGLKIEDNYHKEESTKAKIKNLFELKKVKVFENINDPLQWQKDIRDEWE